MTSVAEDEIVRSIALDELLDHMGALGSHLILTMVFLVLFYDSILLGKLGRAYLSSLYQGVLYFSCLLGSFC